MDEILLSEDEAKLLGHMHDNARVFDHQRYAFQVTKLLEAAGVTPEAFDKARSFLEPLGLIKAGKYKTQDGDEQLFVSITPAGANAIRRHRRDAVR